MNGCCAQRNGFEDSLHYSSPAHGGWGVVKTGHLVPDSYQLFVSPAACGRHGALAACLEKRKNRVSYLFLTEEDIVSGGYEERIIEGAGKLLAHLEKRNRMPRVLMIFVSCIDDLLGTDHDALTEELSAAYPHIRFMFCHMNPTSTDTKLPPGVNIQNKIYSLLDVTKERDQGVNLIGSLSPLRQTSELFTILKRMGISDIRHISNYEGFDAYQEMARSCLNLVISPAGTYASQQMESKHGTPFVTALTSFRTSCIRDTYSRIADKLRVRCPELSIYEEECERRMWETAGKLKGMTVLLDGEAVTRPFDLARALLEHGFQVTHVFEQKVLPPDEENYKWIVSKHPQVNIIQTQNPRVTVFEKLTQEALSIGYSAAYITGAAHVLDLGGQHGLYGYGGIVELMEMMEKAAGEKADLRKLLDDAVLVV